MTPRILTIQKDYSFFLFGPRGSGKTTYLNTVFKAKHTPPLWIDLLDPDEEAL